MAGIHEWLDFQFIFACGHDELTREQRRNNIWLPMGSPAHNALKKVAWKLKLLKDVFLSCRFCTDRISRSRPWLCGEVIREQSQHYSYNGMVNRTQLAVIDHNWNVGGDIATTISGEECHGSVYPKLQKKWVAKPMYKEKTYQFVPDLLSDFA